jgi:hypothetical protein
MTVRALVLVLLACAAAAADTSAPVKTGAPVTWQGHCAARLEQTRVELIRWYPRLRVLAHDGQVDLNEPGRWWFEGRECQPHASLVILPQGARPRRWRQMLGGASKETGGECDYNSWIDAQRGTATRAAVASVSTGSMGIGTQLEAPLAILKRAADDCLAMQ